MPGDEVILRYQDADLILLNGAGYAHWVHHAALPSAKTVNTAQNIGDRLLEVPDTITHSHGPGGVHSHAGIASNTWLDPILAIEQARMVKQALSRRLPDHAAQFDERFQTLADELEALDREIETIVAANPDKPLLASHPVYHYLEARYGLNLVSLHWEPDEMPAPAEWEALEQQLADHPAQWIIWEDDPLDTIKSRLAGLGVTSIVYNPSVQPPADGGGLLTAMRQNAENLRGAFAGGEG